MPRGDGTGPMGMGPMTGRRGSLCMGCARGRGAAANRAAGLGFNRQKEKMFQMSAMTRGLGFCFGKSVGAFRTANEEKEILSWQAGLLKNQLRQVEARLSGIE